MINVIVWFLWIVAGLGVLAYAVGQLWIVVIAFKDSIGRGLGCLFVPLFSWIYTHSQADREEIVKPGWIWVVGAYAWFFGVAINAWLYNIGLVDTFGM